MLPGQFAEIRVDGSLTTFLRRPISINFVDKQRNEVWFLIQLVGDGTRPVSYTHLMTSQDSVYNSLYLTNYAKLNLVDQLTRVPGVGAVNVMGAGDYSCLLYTSRR